MKKVVFLLTALLLATPAMANVTISCAQVGATSEVAVSYLATEDGNLPRGFGLEISVDNGKTIDSISYTDPCYWVYPGSIVITDGNMTGQGTPVVGSLPASSIIVEMGSLHYPAGTGSASAPGLGDVLLKFTVSAVDCNVAIAGNGTRGNVVNYAAEEADVVYTGCSIAPECFPSCHPDYAEWVSVGRPASWCYPKQCHGDGTGSDQEFSRGVWLSVGSEDFTVMLAGYGDTTYVDPATDPWIAGDYTHSAQEFSRGVWMRVGSEDFTALLEYYGDEASTVPADCLDCP